MGFKGLDKGKFKKLGFQRERNLVLSLWKLGFACIRSPASGSKTRRVIYPDIVALKKGTIIVIEAKTSEKRRTIYVRREQVDRLKAFAERAGALAFIGINFIDGTGWRFIPVSDLVPTKGGNYKISLQVVEEKGLDITDLDKIARRDIPLDRFLTRVKA